MDEFLVAAVRGLGHKCSGASCGRWGYCDESVGRCICAPGRHGPDCSEVHFGACRLHAELGEMACESFRGLMSCNCRLQCMHRHGDKARHYARSCWDTLANTSLVDTSDFPEAPDGVIYRTAEWPARGKCAKGNLGVEAERRCISGMSQTTWHAHRALGGSPLPNRYCPDSCSHRGSCLRPFVRRPLGRSLTGRDGWSYVIERDPTNSTAPACICHDGYSGRACQLTDKTLCMNSCSGNGDCVGKFCLCKQGWFGIDCSLERGVGGFDHVAPATARTHSRRRRKRGQRVQGRGNAAGRVNVAEDATLGVTATLGVSERKKVPIWCYPLPSEFSMEFVYQRDEVRRGQFHANLMFYEEMMRNRVRRATKNQKG